METHQAKTHPLDFRIQHDSHSTSWRSPSGRFDGAGIPRPRNDKLQQKEKNKNILDVVIIQ